MTSDLAVTSARGHDPDAKHDLAVPVERQQDRPPAWQDTRWSRQSG
jgi:hypothetical protein